MRKILLFFIVISTSINMMAQPSAPPVGNIIITVVGNEKEFLPFATVSFLNSTDSSLIKTLITDSTGTVAFDNMEQGSYIIKVSRINYSSQYLSVQHMPRPDIGHLSLQIILKPDSRSLKEVVVSARKPFIQQLPDKTVINVESSINSVGTTVLELLERLPGVSIDRDGKVSLKGRQDVMIMIDNKPSYVSGADLATLLNSMSSSQIETIELIDNPSAKYDAAGNAGIINIKTKKNKQKGFNGNISTSYGQGMYPKNNNSLSLNYRNGAFNFFLTYSVNVNQGFSDLYAYRTYFKEDKTIDAFLEQSTFIKAKGYNHTIKTGVDFYAGKKTTLGIIFTGFKLSRTSGGDGDAVWMNAAGVKDSTIHTQNDSKGKYKNGGINFNIRHTLNSSQELTADIDLIGYNFKSNQAFQNNFDAPGGYEEAFKGELPSTIRIFSAKADYSASLKGGMKFESGLKTSHISTDNIAAYFYKDAGIWKEDLGKTNHFLYTENIHAVYGNFEKKSGRWHFQTGLRYELTGYDAHQLGNSVAKDSAFSRTYGSLFPSAFVNYEMDSVNNFTVSAGRRIDRPPFQKLNPFLFILNKYTYQSGNPFIRPQYTWNLELAWRYKDLFSVSGGYNIIKDYFSQIFLADTSGTIIYTEGNAGKMQNFSLSLSAQASPLSWWSFSAEATLNHKIIEGFVWNNYTAKITQLNINLNNQFRFKKGWSAELSGYYITKAQNDLQEVLDPTGQVSLGVSKQVIQNKGTIRLSFRDVFYTQIMAGLTTFQHATEYFKLTRDTRVVTLSFAYRFGKAMKSTVKRSTGGAADEIMRVGNGN